MSAILLFAVMATGFYMMTDSTTVSAQRGDRSARGEITKGEVATPDMLAFALNMRSANGQTVFGEKGIRGDVNGVSGKSSTGSDANLADGLSGMKVRSDLAKSFSAINQLPCEKLEGELTGGSFTPGVYCAPSASLAGNMTLDGEGIYIFRVEGAFKTTDSFGMTTLNGAKGGSVFFVAGDTASIAANSSIEGTIIARNTVDIGEGTTVKGRAYSMDSEVVLGASSNLVLATAIIEICKEAFLPSDLVAPTGTSPGPGNGWNWTLANRIWRFQVNGVFYTAPTGQCTGPIEIASDTPTTITEALDGTFTDRAGVWENRFRLVSVTRTQGPGTVSNVNLPLRTAQVTVPFGTNGDISQQTVIVFTNTFAIPVVIEICKRAEAIGTGGVPGASSPDPDVTGFFNFTVDAIANTVFPVPVGMCSGAIQVLVPTAPGTIPQDSVVIVTEIARAGYTLNTGSTFPADRNLSPDPPGAVLGTGVTNTTACSIQSGDVVNGNLPPAGCTFNNAGGGYIIGRVVEGGTSNQTTYNFFNRTNPGVVKVCKIAGPGVPIGAEFDFIVQGTVQTNAQPFAANVQNRRVRVVAGPAPIGFCEFVRDAPLTVGLEGALTQFVVGTPVYVREYDYIEGTGQTPISLANGGSIRVGRIRMELGAGAFAAAGSNVAVETSGAPPSAFAGYDPPSVTPNPRLGPIDNALVPSSAGGFGDAVFIQRQGTREIEYVNFVFRPTALKICKIAGAGVIEGTSYTFSVVIDTLGGLINHLGTGGPAVANVTVQAGPAASGGFCAFAQGPAGPNPGGPNPFYGNIFTNPNVAAFPVGFNVTVTETGGNVTAVTSPTGTVTGATLGVGGAGTLLLAHAGGFNEIVFTNGTAAPVQTAFSISGRVMTPEGGGLRNAQVVLTKADGSKISVPTSSMGYYTFDNLANETYNVGVSSRRYRFQSRQVELNSSLADVNFTGIE